MYNNYFANEGNNLVTVSASNGTPVFYINDLGTKT